jgi:exodeoxyribonuclease-1
MKTFFWYDYETFGLSPKTQRIAQFAGIRTDEDLNIIDEHMFYCKPTYDSLPSPEACSITGITPQICEKNGLIEKIFISKINNEFSVPDTCIVGYNSINFDDEFTRYTLFRNFIDPYAWHWQNGNSRWDILDVVRFCYALKKDNSLKWSYDENIKPIFKLDKLAPANNIEHSDAHDALADVKATIGIAKIIKTTQPKLFAYALSLRDKREVSKKIELFSPLLHTSGIYSAKLSCTCLTTALAYHPEYSDRALVFNLDQDPSLLIELEVEELKTLIFSKKLPKGLDRLQIKELAFNKSPMFVPNVYKLENKITEQLQIDIDKCMDNLSYIRDNQTQITEKIKSIYTKDSERTPALDVDQSLYDNFIDKTDRLICNEIQNLSSDELKKFKPEFKDKKLSKLLLNFKARNFPESLTENEHEEWFEIVQSRVQNGENGYLSLENFYKSLEKQKISAPSKSDIWIQLEEYAQSFL